MRCLDSVTDSMDMSLSKLQGDSKEQGSLACHSSWGCRVRHDYVTFTHSITGSSAGKESAFNEGDLGPIPGLGRSPGKGHGNPLQFLPRESPWTEEPGRLQSMGLQRVRHD